VGGDEEPRHDAVPDLVRRRRDDFPEEDLLDVPKAAHEVVQEAKDAGVWVFGGGADSRGASGFAIVDVPSREEALEWAAKIAVACRCAQEVRELLPDPTV
jgi:hypothetical protein